MFYGPLTLDYLRSILPFGAYFLGTASETWTQESFLELPTSKNLAALRRGKYYVRDGTGGGAVRMGDG